VSEKIHRYCAGWSAEEVRALRRHLGLSQDGLAEELGMRQQTVSEWETGRYRPRGASLRLLGMIAERAGFEYEAQSRTEMGDGKAELSRGAGESQE
jgi:DNA-binding transcriptional regulator YiaG